LMTFGLQQHVSHPKERREKQKRFVISSNKVKSCQCNQDECEKG
jgi:hypothetical protein